MEKRPLSIYLVMLCSMIFSYSCVSRATGESGTSFRGWDSVAASDTLRIGVTTSPAAFFIFRGEEMGTEFVKIREFAQSKGLALDIRLANSLDTLMHLVDIGSIDLCISPVPMTKSNIEKYAFCGPTTLSSLVLVQRKSSVKRAQTILDLDSCTIHVVANSVEELRLRQIQAELGASVTMNIATTDTLDALDLLTKLEMDSISYTIADKRMAELFGRYHKEIDANLSVSPPLRYAWIAHRRNTSLVDTLGAFYARHDLSKVMSDDTGYAYYFRGNRLETTMLSHKGAISHYDEIFIRESKRLNWPWTILAALAFHESTFDPDVVAWSGAIGLMGIMPSTGRIYGASPSDLKDPEIAVRVAVDCLLEYSKLYDDLSDEMDVIKFTLAAYNAGPGHIMDARKLAQKYGANPDVWDDNVATYVLLKSRPKYYNDDVCRFGYLRGNETINYVQNILARHQSYSAIANHK